MLGSLSDIIGKTVVVTFNDDSETNHLFVQALDMPTGFLILEDKVRGKRYYYNLRYIAAIMQEVPPHE